MLRFKEWLKGERGMSEAAVAIIYLPLLVALIFLLVETGFNMRTRTMTDTILQDTARSAALDGGANNARATGLTSKYTSVKTVGGGWAKVGTERLVAACKDGSVRSTSCSITISCSPAVAKFAGDKVSCWLTTPITYKTLSPMSTNPLFSFGMAGLFTTPISNKIESRAAIGSQG